MHVRSATPDDLESIVELCVRLWPDDGSAADHREHQRATLSGAPKSSLALRVFVAEEADRLLGFIEVGLRSHADGCDGSHACGFIEGLYVVPARRRTGVGRALLNCAEAWARAQGCRELASDTWSDNEVSERVHLAFGFEVVDRCVNFRKPIVPTEPVVPAPSEYYGAVLARVHHDHFGMVARGAACTLLQRLREAGITSGTIVDLAAGSGILSHALSEAGYAAWGVDLSPAMLAIARAETPAATFVNGSLWSARLPSCVAVAAVGEAFSYAADPSASIAALEARLGAIHAALSPGGLLLFDIAAPGRSGESGVRQVFVERDGVYVGVEEREDRARFELQRSISVFLPQGEAYRRCEERHLLRAYRAEDVERVLTAIGYRIERLDGYDDFRFVRGWHGWAAYK